MIIRRGQPSDAGTLRDLFAIVYSEDFFERVQADEARIPELSFVALGDDQEVIGHVGARRGTVDAAPVLAGARGQGDTSPLHRVALSATECSAV